MPNGKVDSWNQKALGSAIYTTAVNMWEQWRKTPAIKHCPKGQPGLARKRTAEADTRREREKRWSWRGKEGRRGEKVHSIEPEIHRPWCQKKLNYVQRTTSDFNDNVMTPWCMLNRKLQQKKGRASNKAHITEWRQYFKKFPCWLRYTECPACTLSYMYTEAVCVQSV